MCTSTKNVRGANTKWVKYGLEAAAQSSSLPVSRQSFHVNFSEFTGISMCFRIPSISEIRVCSRVVLCFEMVFESFGSRFPRHITSSFEATVFNSDPDKGGKRSDGSQIKVLIHRSGFYGETFQ